MRGDRLAAFEALLAQSDERSLIGRGHRQTQAGKPDRLLTIWMHAQRAWVAHELADRRKAIEGWQSAKVCAFRRERVQG